MNRQFPFASGEIYHCYNRGVDKRQIFMDTHDYERFLMLLYACNSRTPIHLSSLNQSNIQGPTLNRVLEIERGEPLVDLFVYCLMPNHPQLIMRERDGNGVTSFMRKVGTGYTMYFNLKYERTGALFSGTFKARHIDSDQYLERATHYVHANPAELVEPHWKEGRVGDSRGLEKFLREYRFSSLPDYEAEGRPESKILDRTFLRENIQRPISIEELLRQAPDFYSRCDLE